MEVPVSERLWIISCLFFRGNLSDVLARIDFDIINTQDGISKQIPPYLRALFCREVLISCRIMIIMSFEGKVND